MVWIIMNLTAICWLEMDSMTCGNVVGYFIPMAIIHTLVIFIAGKSRFHGILFVDWDTYDTLWCSEYWSTIKIGLPLGVKNDSNLRYTIFYKGLFWEINFSVGGAEKIVPFINEELGDHKSPNLLLYSSNFADEKYLSFLVRWYYHFTFSLLLL